MSCGRIIDVLRTTAAVATYISNYLTNTYFYVGMWVVDVRTKKNE